MILITGGGVGGTRRSVEVLRSDGSPLSCNIPKMPNDRYWHTQSGLRVCGGHGGVSMVGDEMENEIYFFYCQPYIYISCKEVLFEIFIGTSDV